MQLCLRELAKEKGGLLVLRCAAHIMNVRIRDIFKLKEPHAAISANQIPRYAETQRNSRVERMGQLRGKCDTEELKEFFDACLQRTLPLLKVLN